MLLTFCLFALSAPVLQQLFHEPRDPFPVERMSASAVASGDLDGDGDLDLAFSRRGPSGTVRIWWNRGLDGFESNRNAISVQSAGFACADLQLRDLDRDGDDDVFVTADPFRVYLSQPPGPFIAVDTRLPVSSEPSNRILVEDLDGDGQLDVFVARTGADGLYLGMPQTGFFEDRSYWLPVYQADSTDVVSGDWNRDGDMDLAVAAADGLRVLLKSGYHWTLGQHLPPGAALSLAAGDFDGDGDLDLFLGRDRTDELFLNDGLGSFTLATNRIPPDDSNTWNAEVIDADLDGDLDLALARSGNAATGPLPSQMLWNDGSGSFTATSGPSRLPPRAGDVLVKDLDADGDPDLVYVSGSSRGQETVHLNDGAGRFSPHPSSMPPDEFTALDLAAAEFNGEPGLDFVLVGVNSGYAPATPGIRPFWSDGGTRYQFALNALPDGLPTRVDGLDSADYDGDGSADLLAYSTYWGGQPTVYTLLLNSAAGSFTDASAGIPASVYPHSLFRSGDLDGDGDSDLVLGRQPSTTTFGLLLNNGDGTFADASATMPSVPNDPIERLELADLDGDGDLDLLAILDGVYSQFVGAVFLNDGSAGFTELPGAFSSLSGFNPVRGLVFDADGDGDLDLAVMGSSRMELFLNDGTGLYTNLPGSFSRGSPFHPRFLSAADLEGDGDLDVLAVGGEDVLFLNDGAGVFAEAVDAVPRHPDAYKGTAAVFTDLDQDGDADLLHFGEQLSRVLIGGDTRLRLRGIAQLGRPARFDLTGHPGEGFELLASTRPGNRQTAIGRLMLDLRFLVGRNQGGLDQNGAAVVDAQVPLAATWIGRRFYLQALLFSPLRLSNFEVAEITPY